MPRDLTPLEERMILEAAVHSNLEHRITGDLESEVVTYAAGKKLMLRWSESMPAGSDYEKFWVVDHAGREYVLDIEVYLNPRTPKVVVNEHTQLPLEYSPEKEGE